MLQVIISPAKQMRVARDSFAPRGIPPFPRQTEQLFRELRRIERNEGAEGLRRLWNVNDALLTQNMELLDHFEIVRDEAVLDDPAIATLVSPAVFSSFRSSSSRWRFLARASLEQSSSTAS